MRVSTASVCVSNSQTPHKGAMLEPGQFCCRAAHTRSQLVTIMNVRDCGIA